jgi:hypothetical protein
VVPGTLYLIVVVSYGWCPRNPGWCPRNPQDPYRASGLIPSLVPGSRDTVPNCCRELWMVSLEPQDPYRASGLIPSFARLP